jgi:DNA-binding transcriptional LysR family regulator
MRETFNIRQLEAFRAVIKHGAVSRAADSLYITQSAVSKLIAALEEQTGLTLFERSSGRLRPTSDALKLFDQSDRVFSELSGLSRKVQQLKNNGSRSFAIGFLPALASQYSAEICRIFRQEHPDIELSLVIGNTPAIKEMLINRKLDVGVVATPIDHPSFTAEPILNSSLVLIMPQGHPLADQEGVHARDLDGLDFVDYNPDDPCSALQTKLFGQFGSTPRFTINGTTASVVINLVAAGFGAGLVHPASAHWRRPDLCIKPFYPKTPISYYFCHDNQPHNAELIQYLRHCMQRVHNHVFHSEKEAPCCGEQTQLEE